MEKARKLRIGYIVRHSSTGKSVSMGIISNNLHKALSGNVNHMRSIGAAFNRKAAKKYKSGVYVDEINFHQLKFTPEEGQLLPEEISGDRDDFKLEEVYQEYENGLITDDELERELEAYRNHQNHRPAR